MGSFVISWVAKIFGEAQHRSVHNAVGKLTRWFLVREKELDHFTDNLLITDSQCAQGGEIAVSCPIVCKVVVAGDNTMRTIASAKGGSGYSGCLV